MVIAFVLHTKGPKFDPWSVHFLPEFIRPHHSLPSFRFRSIPVIITFQMAPDDSIDGREVSGVLRAWENTCAVIRIWPGGCHPYATSAAWSSYNLKSRKWSKAWTSVALPQSKANPLLCTVYKPGKVRAINVRQHPHGLTFDGSDRSLLSSRDVRLEGRSSLSNKTMRGPRSGPSPTPSLLVSSVTP